MASSGTLSLRSGRISLLASRDLATFVQAVRGLPAAVNEQIRAQTRKVAEPVWQEEVRGRVTTRLQARVLSDTARVSVSDTNVTVKSAMVGTLSSGTRASTLAPLVELGGMPGKKITTHSRKGKSYSRRMGSVAGLPRSGGYVVFPAVREAVVRLASLWMQTGVRTVHEIFEKGGAR